MSTRCVLLVQSKSRKAFGDYFVISMVCSLGVTLDVRRDNREGVRYGKEELQDLINTGTGK